MRFLTVGIIDYNVGNLISVEKTLFKLGYRCRLTKNIKVLEQTDVLIMPGVGAFPYAMQNIKNYGLFDFILDWAKKGKPIIGICLGMQLLSKTSFEIKKSSGLGLIPGEVIELNEDWHIGWNSILDTKNDINFKNFNGRSFYFNHSFYFKTKDKFITSRVEIVSNNKKYTASVKKDNIVGLQFHPEKSQLLGKKLLDLIIKDLCNA